MNGFDQTRQQILHRALRITGVMDKNATTVSSAIYDACDVCLNTLNEDLRNEGVFLWQKKTFDITTVASTGEYAIPTTPDKYETVEKAWIVGDDGTDYRIKPMSENDYYDITKKGEEGKPTYFSLEHDLDADQIRLWPVPDAVYTVRCLGVKLLPELINNSDEPSYPSKWLNVLTFGTAYLYANEAQLPDTRVAMLYEQYQRFLGKAKTRERDIAPTFIENAYDNNYDSSLLTDQYDYGG